MFEMGTTAAVVAVSAVIAGPAAIAPVSTEARELAALLNQTRAAVGLPALTFSAPLSDVAQWYAEQMASGDVPFEHNQDLWKQLPSGWVLAGENIAFRSSGTVADLHMQWVNSPGHYANMLRGFDNVGIGYAVSDTGRIYAVQVFGLYLSPLEQVPEVPAPVETSTPEPSSTPTSVPTSSKSPILVPVPTPTSVPTPVPVPTPTVAPIPTSRLVPVAVTEVTPVPGDLRSAPFPTRTQTATPAAPSSGVSQASGQTQSEQRRSSEQVPPAAAAPNEPKPTQDNLRDGMPGSAGVVPAESMAAPGAPETPPTGPSLAALGIAGSALAVGLGGTAAVALNPTWRSRIRAMLARR